MIKALFFDLDGTLLNDAKKIPDTAAAALRECRKKGILVFLASARSPRLNETLGWTERETSLFDGGIYSNGGYVDAGNEKGYAFICQDVVKECVQAVCKWPDVHLSLHTPGHGYTFNFPVTEKLMEGWGITSENLRPMNGETMAGTAKMLVFWEDLIGQTKKMPQALCDELAAICRGRAKMYVTDKGAAMQVTAMEAGKKNAVERVCRMLGLGREEVAVFGDDVNDLEVIQAFPVSVAMGNGEEEVKRAAKYVAPANEEDGIAHALRMLGLIK